MLIKLHIKPRAVCSKIIFDKTKLMPNLVPDLNIAATKSEIEIMNKYIYLGHEIKIDIENQTRELQRRISLSWTAFEKTL